MTPGELACFCGLEAAEELLRPSQQKAEPGMSALWPSAASRLAEERMRWERCGVCWRAEPDPNSIWRGATPLRMAPAHPLHFRVADG
jgi:hypothetical protein